MTTAKLTIFFLILQRFENVLFCTCMDSIISFVVQIRLLMLEFFQMDAVKSMNSPEIHNCV